MSKWRLALIGLWILLAAFEAQAGPAPSPVDLGIEVVTSNSTPTAGGAAFSYTLTVTNHGPGDASGISVIDALPEGVLFQNVSIVNNPSVPGYGLICSGPPVRTNGTVICNGKLPGAAASTSVITIVAQMADEVSAGMRTNTAWVRSDTQEVDPNLNPNTDSVQQTIQVAAPMAMSLAATAQATAGDTILYQLTVNNNGSSAAVYPFISQALPPGVQFLGLYGTGDLHESCTAKGGGRVIECAPDFIHPGNHRLLVVTETFRLTTPAGFLESTVTLSPGTGTETNSPVSASTEVLITTHTFTVSKDYSDDSETPVSVTVSCTGDAVVTPAGAVQLSDETPVEWTITRFLPEEEQNCIAQESPVPAGYLASGTPAGSCESGQLEDEGSSSCTITNEQLPVNIYASKVFTSGGGSADFVIDCGGEGDIEVVNSVASPGTPAHFIISDFPWDGATCNVTEPVPPSGYYVSATSCEGLLIEPSNDDTLCEITNSQSRATFKVTKQFLDGNDSDEVIVSIDCNTGLILDQDKDLADGESVEFVITDFTDGTLDCNITEDGETGYGGEYYDVASVQISDISCEYHDVGGGDANECEISNSPLPVDVEITKNWVFESSTAEDISTEFTLTLYCESEIVDGYPLGSVGTSPESPAADVLFPCGLDTPGGNVQGLGQFEWCKVHSGNGPDVFTDQVIPEYPNTDCVVVESGTDDAVEVENGCLNITVSAGSGAACTVTNTVFFEGIPTLGDLGRWMLVMLMLTVGMVAFRRQS